MARPKDEYHEQPSYFQSAIDTALLPIRIATSPALLRTYLRTILLLITSSILFALAVIAYSSFYYSYIPVRGISVPIYLQFDHGKPSSFHNAQSDDGLFGQMTKWPYGLANVPDLVSRQKYDVVVEMTVPRSRANLNAGNWMVGLELRGPSTVGSGGVKGMLGWDEEWNVEDHSQSGRAGVSMQKAANAILPDRLPVLARSKRPAILTYRSYIIEHAYRFLRLPLYILGWYVESEHIEIGMMEGVEFDKGAKNIPSSVRVEVRSRVPLEIYAVSVRFSAKLEGLRWIMYRYWMSSAAAGIFLFWSVEMGVLLFTWAIFTLLFSRPAEPESYGRKKIKHESTDTTIKREEGENTEPDTPLSDASRTFPTLPSQQPLHYTSTSPATPKDERSTPALEDIPMREEAEADDEDDDYVLQEPVPIRTEREGVFTDSGVGTSIESSIERDRGLNRRRSGRLREDER